MKKLIAFILSAVLIFSVAFCAAYAKTYDYFYASGDFYPESEHDYPNDVFYTWEYSWPSETDGLFITFSEETMIDPENHRVEEEWGPSVTSDYIYLSYLEGEDNWVSISSFFVDDELSGKTFYIPSRVFRITLTSDAEGTAYGFSFDRISTELPENETVIRYHYDNDSVPDYYSCHGTGAGVVEDIDNLRNGDKAFAGWSTEQGGTAEFTAGVRMDAGEIYDIYAVWIDPIIAFEDSFSFFNGDVGSTYPAEENYYMTDEHYNMMLLNLFKNFGIGPIPAPIIAAVLSTYPSWYHKGSCYGIATSVFLQHHGAIDFLEGTTAEKMSEVKLNAETISRINYYQALSASSYLCENLAPDPQNANYTRQLKSMFETVESGKPVLFSFYDYDSPYLFSTGHTVVFTGAYTDRFGNHYLVADDSNYDYSNGECHYFVIGSDFGRISDCGSSPNSSFNSLVGGFNWTADYEHFTSFDINGEGNPIAWYTVFFAHAFAWFRSLISNISMIY